MADKILNIGWLKNSEGGTIPYIDCGLDMNLANPWKDGDGWDFMNSLLYEFFDEDIEITHLYGYMQLGGISSVLNIHVDDPNCCWFCCTKPINALTNIKSRLGDALESNLTIYILPSHAEDITTENDKKLLNYQLYNGTYLTDATLLDYLIDNLEKNNGIVICDASVLKQFNVSYNLTNDFDVSVDMSESIINADLVSKINDSTYCPTKQEILDITNNPDSIGIETLIVIDATTVKANALSNKYFVIWRNPEYPFYSLAKTSNGISSVNDSDYYIENALNELLNAPLNTSSHLLGVNISGDYPWDPQLATPERLEVYEILLIPVDADYITKIYKNNNRDVYEITRNDGVGWQFWTKEGSSSYGGRWLMEYLDTDSIKSQFKYWNNSILENFYKLWILNENYGKLIDESSIIPITAWNGNDNWLNPDAEYVIDEGITLTSNGYWNTTNYNTRKYAQNQLVKEKDIILKPSSAPPPTANDSIQNKTFIIEYIIKSVFIAHPNTAIAASHWRNVLLTVPPAISGQGVMTVSIGNPNQDLFIYSGGSNYTIGSMNGVSSGGFSLVQNGSPALQWRPSGTNQQWQSLQYNYPSNGTTLYDLKFIQSMKLSGFAGEYEISQTGTDLDVYVESNGATEIYTDFIVYFSTNGVANLNKVNISPSTNVPIYLTAEINIQSGEGNGNSGSGGGVALTEPPLILTVGGEERNPYWDCEVEADCGYIEGVGTVINIGYTDDVTLELGSEWNNVQGLKIKFNNVKDSNLSYTWRFNNPAPPRDIIIVLGGNTPSSTGYVINKNVDYNIHLLNEYRQTIDPETSYIWSLGDTGEVIPKDNMTLCEFEILYSIDDGNTWKSFNPKKYIRWMYPGYHIPH